MTERIEAGRRFEKIFLGKSGTDTIIRNKRGLTFNIALQNAVKNLDGQKLHPDTDGANTLYYHVKKHLRGLGVNTGKLILLPSVDTAADVGYQTDAVVYLKTGAHEYVVTLDLSFSANPTVAEGFVKVTNETYLTLQSEIYDLKRKVLLERLKRASELKKDGKPVVCYWPAQRPANHFILTQFDVFRRRGLKTLGREIAHSLFHQVKEKEGEKKEEIGEKP